MLRPARPLASVLSAVALCAAAVWWTSPPPPRGTDAPADAFSAGRAARVLERLLGDGKPHPTGTAEHAAFRERLLVELAALGLVPTVEEGFACSPGGACTTVRNVVAELPGTERGPSVLLAAHTDSVGAAPGASDDASGVACVLEAARALLESPRRNPVLLLFDDGEELGLLGAELFVRSPRARSVGAVVNLEARGTTGPSLLFETSRDNAWLVRAAVSRLPRPVTSSVHAFVYDRLPNDTDLSVFKRAGMPGLNLAFIGSAARYHTHEDRLGNLSLGTLQHQGENALALARALADADLTTPRPGAAVFFDLLGFVVVSWPRGLSVPIALLALAAVAAAAVRRGGFRPGWRWLVPTAGPFAGAVAGLALWKLLGWAGAFPVTFGANLALATAAAALAGLAAALPLLAWESRRAGPEERTWERIWLPGALAGFALAALAPEFSYLLVVPALVAGLVRLAFLGAWTAWPPFLLSGALLLPAALRLPEAVGPVALPLVALAAGAVLGSVPVVLGAERVRLPAISLAALALLTATAALLTPAVTPDRPESGSILAVQEAGAAGGRLAYLPASGRLHREVAAAAPFGPKERAFPWSTRATAFGAPLPAIPDAPPQLEVVREDALEDGRRRLSLRLRSPRGAGSIGLLVPDGSGVADSLVEGVPFAPAYRKGPARPRKLFRLTCPGAPPEGVSVELTLPAGRLEAYVLDQSPGLPVSARRVASARPALVQPADAGDSTVLYRRVSL